MRLNLGCGPNDIRAGYINIDIRDVGAVQCDVSDPIAMAKYYGASEILAYDVLEHFDREMARGCLEMWVAMLAPGGVIKIRCPDFRYAATLPQTDEWLEQLLYGRQDYPENQHLCGFTTAMLTKLLTNLDLKVTHKELTDAGNLEIMAVKCG